MAAKQASGAEWWFYHISQGSIEGALGPLLEKCLQRSWRVVVSGKRATLAKLDTSLWTWRDDSFLPHGKTGPNAAAQPILLSETPDPANGAKVAILLDGLEVDPSRFERCIVVFDGADEPARSMARKQYKSATDSGQTARYFQQDASSGWKEWQPQKN